MGNNFKFGYNFVSYTPTASSSATDYPDDNLLLYAHPFRQWRSAVTTEVTISFDLGASWSGTLLGLMLNDVNFTSIYTASSANGSSWGTETQWTISRDDRVWRYKIFAALSYTQRYVRVRIPAQTPTDGLAYFRIGGAVCLNTVLELASNPTHPYEYQADEAINTNRMPSGVEEDVILGDLIWEGSFAKDSLDRTNESDYWTLNSLGKSGLLCFYENAGDTSKCYICRRRSVIQVAWKEANIDSISKLTFREVR